MTVFKLQENKFAISESDGKLYSKTQLKNALISEGILENEINEMFNLFDSQGHDVASFGVRGTLIYTDNLNKSKVMH